MKARFKSTGDIGDVPDQIYSKYPHLFEPIDSQQNLSSPDNSGMKTLYQNVFNKASSMKERNSVAEGYKSATGEELFGKPKEKILSSGQAKNLATATSGLSAIKTLEDHMNKDPEILLKSALPFGGVGSTRRFNTARNEIKDILTRLRTGAVINKDEMKFYSQQIPNALDSILDPSGETVRYKLNLYRNFFNSLAGKIQTSESPATQERTPLEDIFK